MSSFTQCFFFVILIVGLSKANAQGLQTHVSFFDRNHDGVIYPLETFEGFRAVGCSIPVATGGTLFVHIFLSAKTRSGKYPALNLPIEIENIHKAKQYSDTGAFDAQGSFNPAKFEEIFTKFAKSNPNSLTYNEVLELVKSFRKPNEKPGWVESAWLLLFNLAKDQNNLLQKTVLRSVYDGSIFPNLEKAHKGGK